MSSKEARLPYQTLWPMFEELRGERVVLRPYRLEDAAEVQAAVAESRDHLWPWEDLANELQTVEEARARIARRTAYGILREWFSIGLWLAETDRHLGGLALNQAVPGGWSVPTFSLAYWIRASEQGHGYISEAAHLLTDYAFDVLGAQRIEIRCDARNIRSAAVAQRLAFGFEGRLRNRGHALDGVLYDELVFGLTPADSRWPVSS